MENAEPIYSYIQNHMTNGRLPEDFAIPWISSMWAPGAQDGVMLYHMHPDAQKMSREDEAEVLRALTMLCGADSLRHIPEILSVFEDQEKKRPIACSYDDIHRLIGMNQKRFNMMQLFHFGNSLVHSGVSLLAVKVGLTLLGGFHVPPVEDLCTVLGSYDEFTYFSARFLSVCGGESNEKLFRLARGLDGWGRIHAVYYLSPDTREIRDWLLYEGADNSIDPQYSADLCLEKSGAKERLGSNTLSDQEFRAVGRLIQICLDSGPYPGLTDADDLLEAYLKAAKSRTPDPDVTACILKGAGQFGISPSIAAMASEM